LFPHGSREGMRPTQQKNNHHQTISPPGKRRKLGQPRGYKKKNTQGVKFLPAKLRFSRLGNFMGFKGRPHGGPPPKKVSIFSFFFLLHKKNAIPISFQPRAFSLGGGAIRLVKKGPFPIRKYRVPFPKV